MAYLKISKINPIALRQSNSSYEAISPLFIDALKNFEYAIEFYQKWQNSDTIIVQYSTDDIDTTASMKLVSCVNEYSFTISQLTPNIEYVGGKRFMKSSLALTSVVEGYYQVQFNITIDGKTYYFTSEPMHVAATQDNTTLIKYTHDANMFDALFLNSVSNEYFYVRVVGGYKYSDITPASKDEIFIDMNQQSTQLDVRPYDLYKFTFGDCAGLPFWMIEIVRYAIGLNEIYFDNIRFCKFEGAKLEKEQIDSDNYPLCSYSIDMQKIPQDYSIEFEDGLPVVITEDITSITDTTAIGGGEVTSEGEYPVTSRGICYDTTTNPDVSKTKTTNGTGLGIFVSNLSGLNDETTYYVKAYAINNIGIAYGEQKTFTTEKTLPAIDTWFFEHERSTGNLDVKILMATKDSEGTANFTIDWGDDETDSITILTETSGGTIITHTYAIAGNYLVTLIGSEANHNKISIIDNIPFDGVPVFNEMTKFYGNEKWINLKYLKIRGFDDAYTGMQLTSITTKSTWTNLQFLWLHNNKELTGVATYNTWTSLVMLLVHNNKLSTINNYAELIGITYANLSYNQLTETAVNNYLTVEDGKAITGARLIYVENGTNAAPTGAGLTAKSNLISRSYTVTTN